MTKDDIIRQIEDLRRRRRKAERQLLLNGRGHPLYNEAEAELTLEEYQHEGSSTRSEEHLLELLDEERRRYNHTITFF